MLRWRNYAREVSRKRIESNACDFNQLSKHQSSNMELCSDRRLALPVLFNRPDKRLMDSALTSYGSQSHMHEILITNNCIEG